MNFEDKESNYSAKSPLIVGFLSITVLIGVIGVWSISVTLTSAVIASGVVQVATDRQVVQHPDGGVVQEILVRDGSNVRKGEVLVSLDNTFLRSELAQVEMQLLEIFVRRALYSAERDNAKNLNFDNLPQYETLNAQLVKEHFKSQSQLFHTRRVAFTQEVAQLEEKKLQLASQISGFEAQLAALRLQLKILVDEITDVESLLKKGFVQVSRFRDLRNKELHFHGEIGRLNSQMAEAKILISSASLEILKISDRRRADAMSRLRDLYFSEIELLSKRRSLLEKISRLDLRAPMDGVVFASRVTTLRSVVRPAEELMYIVPRDQPLTVLVSIDANDVAKIYPGQSVKLVFTAFDPKTTPELFGHVIRVSPDARLNDATGFTYFETVIEPDFFDIDGPRNFELLPGMRVEAFIRTMEKTPLTYLMEPFTRYFNRAFRES